MAKTQIYEKVTNLSEKGFDNGISDVESHWKPGYFKQFPLKATAALLFVLLATLASVAVLCISDRKSSSEWSQAIEPSVVLSILTAATSIALATAMGEGVSIAWWRRAMSGATIAELHESWRYTSSAVDAMGGIFRLSTIPWAVLATKLVLVDNILFQRATSSYVHMDSPKPVSLLGAAATSFPTTGFVVASGFAAQTSCECFMIGDSFTPVVNTWETSNGFFQGYNKLFQSCDGVCYTHMPAIGFEIDCTRQENHTDIAAGPVAAFDTRNATGADKSEWMVPIFNSSFFMAYEDRTTNYSSIAFSLQYFQSDDPYNPSGSSCRGNVFNIQCKLRPAIVNYPLAITNFSNPHVNNGVSLGSIPSTIGQNTQSYLSSTTGQTVRPYNYTLKQAEGFTVQEYLYPKEGQSLNSTTSLGGIASALSQYLSSNAVITYTGDAIWALKQQGALAQTMMYGPPNMGSCDCSFRHDALDTVVSQINQLAFLTSTGLIDNTAVTFPSEATTSLLGFTFPAPSFLNKKPTANVNTSTQVTIQGINSNTTTNFRVLEPSVEIRDVVFYRTHYLFLGLGVGFTLFCIILVMLPFWRYGEIGRQITLGPIEIAGAFGAPALTAVDTHSSTPLAAASPVPHSVISPGHAHQNSLAHTASISNATPVLSPSSQQISFTNVDELIASVGHRKVMYGRVEVEEDETLPASSNILPGQAMVASPTGEAPSQSPFSPASTMSGTISTQAGISGKRRRTQVLTFDDLTGGRVKPLNK